MSPNSHKSEYTILLVLAILSALVLLALMWQGLVHEDRSGRSGVRTTRSTNIDGVLACYELFKRLEIPVERSYSMLLSNRIEKADVIFLIDPIQPLNPGEIMDLGTWIEQGGVLVASEHRGQLKDLDPALDHSIEESSSSRENPSLPRTLPLSRDVSATVFETTDVFALRLSDDEPANKVVEPLFEDHRGLRIVEHPLGRGCLIVLSDSSFLANDHIGKDDNSVLAINLAVHAMDRSPGQRIVFDEYHFGFGDGNAGFRVLAGMLFTTSAGWAVLTLTAAGILLLLYKGRQFGPRRDLAKLRRRRSKMEYIYAVGATYRHAGAHRLTLSLIYNWFRQQAAGRTGLAPTASNRSLAQGLARHSQADTDEVQGVLDNCDALLARTTISQHQLTAALSRLAQIEKEALDGLGNGKRTRP
ncbi:MAG: DUF4350 domain-containing protein [Phycisphaerales bacterium]